MENDELTILLDGPKGGKGLLRAYIPSVFISAALPLREVKRNVFERRYNNITLKLSGAKGVPYGKYGRLLLSVFTTHAVLEKNSAGGKPVLIRYESMKNLLDELRLPKQRSGEIMRQLESYSQSTFVYEEKVARVAQKSLFAEFLDEGESARGKVNATKITTGIIPFFNAMQYVQLTDAKGEVNRKNIAFTIELSPNFVELCAKHSVPINYSVYKDISSPLGKDLYAWLVYRNNALRGGQPVFVPRGSMVEQFMPVASENSDPAAQERVNWSYIKDQIAQIKRKYYPEMRMEFASDGTGLVLFRSPSVIEPDDKRYILITDGLKYIPAKKR